MYKKPKYPRIVVSLSRHKKLRIEAEKRNITTQKLAEEKFKIAEQNS